MPTLYIILIVALVGLLLFTTFIAAVGMVLPRRHVASVSLTLGKPIEVVWEAISNISSQPAWRTGLLRVDRRLDAEGREVWIEVYKGGPGAIALRTDVSDPPRRLVRRIVDDALPFGGAWEYLVEPTSNGCRVVLSEHGEIKNPIFRVLSRFVFGHYSSLEIYLRDLSRRFEESSVPERLK